MKMKYLTMPLLIGLSIVNFSYANDEGTGTNNDAQLLEVMRQSTNRLELLLTNQCLGAADLSACKRVHEEADVNISVLKKITPNQSVARQIEKLTMLATVSGDAEKTSPTPKSGNPSPINITYQQGHCVILQSDGHTKPLPKTNTNTLFIPAGSLVDIRCLQQ